MHAPLKRRFAAVLSATALSLGALPAAQATVYGLAGDWSDTQNPNGPWSYLAAGLPLPSVADFIGFGPAWQDLRLHPSGGNGFTPGLFQFDGTGGEPIDALAGDIVGHSDDGVGVHAGAGVLSIRFTSPTAGLAQVSGNIWDAHLSVDRTQAWSLWVDNVLQASGLLLGDGSEGRNNPDLFSVPTANLQAGSVVELFVSRYQNGIGGLFGANLTIDIDPARVPAPATGLLAALGLLALARRPRRAATVGA